MRFFSGSIGVKTVFCLPRLLSIRRTGAGECELSDDGSILSRRVVIVDAKRRIIEGDRRETGATRYTALTALARSTIQFVRDGDD